MDDEKQQGQQQEPEATHVWWYEGLVLHNGKLHHRFQDVADEADAWTLDASSGQKGWKPNAFSVIGGQYDATTRGRTVLRPPQWRGGSVRHPDVQAWRLASRAAEAHVARERQERRLRTDVADDEALEALRAGYARQPNRQAQASYLAALIAHVTSPMPRRGGK